MKTLILTILPVLAIGLLGCNTMAGGGALAGTALGAGLGAVVGNQSGNAGEGALIGGAAGAVTGAIIGNELDKNRRYSNPGHWETRIVRTPSGHTYEERVWVPDR
ncbi:MAG: hypothetical protein HYV26_13245 [Candidatus Hydrogenedentes bacterium]|nr:hypothetical protein [Candidatus Hydrogenedentota bacterium]MBI3118292.1 hypothetical protein [Candidatus Hydrogenedentota bacterium]